MLNRKNHNLRAAFTFVELIAAIFVVGLCIVAFAKIANTAQQQRQLGQTHQTAVDQLQNILEQLAATAPEQLAAGQSDLTPYKALIARAIPTGELTVTCEPLANDAAEAVQTWRLDASVSWQDNAHQPRRNVSLTRLLSKSRPAMKPPEQTIEETPTPAPEGGAE